MTRHVLLVGDPEADPLLRALPAELKDRGLASSVVAPLEFATVGVTVSPTGCSVRGTSVQGIVFRLSPMLLVAPGYDEADAGFAVAELRAVWVQLLAQPDIAAVNRPDVDGWLSSSEWSAWRRRLAEAGVACAPRRIGTPFPNGWGVRWSGAVATLPEASAAQRLGAASVAAGPLRTVLCCAGDAIGDPGEQVDVDRELARALLGAGLVLAEATLDGAGRVVSLSALPPVPEARAGSIAGRMAGWLDAAVGR